MIKYNLSDVMEILNKSFKKMFYEFDFRVKTEISSLDVYTNRVYLELVETENGQVKAKSDGIIFDKEVWNNFKKEVDISIQELKNYKFLFHAKFNFHPKYGLSIVVNEISTKYTLGQLKQNKDNIIKKLKKDGIYKNNHQTTLGYPLYDIAIVSSSNAEGFRDFQNVLEESDYQFDSSLYQSQMQGNGAKQGVLQALSQIKNDIENGQDYDIIAIVRGGGGSSGILRQDDLQIAKSICQMGVPVILGIGHTSDKYILDKIAKFACKTPTEAGTFLVSQVDKYNQNLDSMYENINRQVTNKFEKYKKDLDSVYEQIQLNYKQKIKNIQNSLDSMYQNIQSFDLDHMVKKGYGVLMDSDGEYLSKEEIENLDEGDKMTIRVYGRQIEVEVR